MEFNFIIKIFLIVVLFFINERYYYLTSKEIKNKIKINKFYSDASLSSDQTNGQYPGFENLQLNYLYEC